MLKQQYESHIMNTYARFDPEIKTGNGCLCEDFDGKEYLDFTSGIGVNSLGFCDPEWVNAVSNQAAKLNHTSNLYYTEPAGNLAKLLCENSGMSKAFFGNSGAEANECSIKIARKYSRDKYGDDRNVIVTLKNSFHGRTITTLSATGQESFHNHFFPFTEGFIHVEPNNIAALDEALNGKICAIMLELVMGEGGVINLTEEYLRKVKALAIANDISLIIDEVQTGIGRTGTLFMFQKYEFLKPNIVSCAKGLGGGLPIGATLADREHSKVLNPGDHASTYGGNPIACAAGTIVLKRICESGFMNEVSLKGDLLKTQLLEIPQITQVSGSGLMLGATLQDGIDARKIVGECLKKGLMLLTAKEKLRFLPPLVITKEQIYTGITILKEVLSKF